MNDETSPYRSAIIERQGMLEREKVTPEVAIKSHFAREFGHIALRHEQGDITEHDYNRFRELYITKASKHATVIDQKANARDFDMWVDAMMPAAIADLEDAKRENEDGELPVFVSPSEMSEITESTNDSLMLEKLQLTEENRRLVRENQKFMDQMMAMSKELRLQKARCAELQRQNDDYALGITVGSIANASSAVVS